MSSAQLAGAIMSRDVYGNGACGAVGAGEGSSGGGPARRAGTQIRVLLRMRRLRLPSRHLRRELVAQRLPLEPLAAAAAGGDHLRRVARHVEIAQVGVNHQHGVVERREEGVLLLVLAATAVAGEVKAPGRGELGRRGAPGEPLDGRAAPRRRTRRRSPRRGTPALAFPGHDALISFAVGVSGGPDSMALCVLAAAWKKAEEGVSGTKAGEEGAAASGFVDGLLGVVVDHGLRPESAEEAQLVRDRVHGMGVMCEIARCQWPDGRPKQGHLQEAAREMRYQKLLDICIKQQIGILLIAHHSDDQAELFVLRLSRNSGVLGLAGTAFVSQLFAPNLKYDGENFSSYGILLVRPMLEFSKDDMYKICQGSNHLWVEDPTNNSMLYARNRIRASLRSLSTEGTFQSELHKLIYACRLTRACTDNACSLVLKQSVTVVEYGYIVIDLEKLDPRNVDDLCLSQFLAYVLQFISQRHRPIRGRSVRLLMDYIRSIPCKAALTVAGCYLCAAPRSKGTKILVCCSVDSMESSSVEMSYKCSYEEQPPPVPDIDQIVLEARLYSNQFLEKCSSIPFVSSKSSSDVLNKAKDLSLIDDFTLEKLYYLRTEEHQKFTTTKEDKHEEQYLDKTSSPDTILSLWLGETCHFMSRFLIMWKPSEFAVNGICFHDSQKHLCRYCIVNQDGSLAVRHMFDTDWLFLAEVSKIHLVEEGTNGSKVSSNKLEDDKLLPHTRYLQLSAMKALEILRSIPASARRTLPVLINSQGDILSIPSIGFRCCPSLSIEAVFNPRVPLGGGYTSYL